MEGSPSADVQGGQQMRQWDSCFQAHAFVRKRSHPTETNRPHALSGAVTGDFLLIHGWIRQTSWAAFTSVGKSGHPGLMTSQLEHAASTAVGPEVGKFSDPIRGPDSPQGGQKVIQGCWADWTSSLLNNIFFVVLHTFGQQLQSFGIRTESRDRKDSSLDLEVTVVRDELLCRSLT